MKRQRAISIILAAAVCFGLSAAAAGCGKKNAVETSPAETSAAATETVSEVSETETPPAETVPLSEADAESSETAEESASPATDDTGESSEDETGTTADTTAEEERKNGLVQEEDGTYYYRNGEKQTGWQTIDGKRYFFQSNGVMLKNTIYGRYSIDANGVCTDRFATITSSNLSAYADYLLDQNGRSLKSVFNYFWKNYLYRYAPRIGTLAGMTDANRLAMICRFLNNGYGPCTDFAYTLQYFCQKIGYEARVVTGEGVSHNEHDWVLVQVSPGTWRHMDALYKSQYLYLLTDDQLARYDDGINYRFRWDRSKWTSTTSSGTGGVNPTLPETTEADETTAAPTEDTAEEDISTAAAPEETTAAQETTAAAETTQAPPETTTQAPEPETTTQAPPPETTAPAATEQTTQPADGTPEETGGAAAGGKGLTAEG